jgi:HlyD family secretion protein
MKKWLLIIIALAVVAGSAGAYYRLRTPEGEVKVSTLPVSRGEIVESVGATGTLQAVTTVQVGSQVSGNIKALYADFNSIVKKGQVVAELDPSLIQTQIEQARANLTRSQADVDRLRVSAEDARNKLKRSQSLFERKLVSPQDLEAAQVAVRAAEAQLKSAEAAVIQSQASLNQADVNLNHTVIEAPIDGIVISRNVDVGQTVAASMNAPTLFIIAADLTKMQVNANVDESDVGRIRPGQRVRFRVDAYPTEEFLGTVAQVRLQPVVQQNVVTYGTVIDVPNPQLKLKPGMTANVTIEIAKRSDVLRVPNAALRFRPTTDTFAALNQEVPPEMQRGMGGFGQGRGPGAAAAQSPGAMPPAAGAAAAAPTPPSNATLATPPAENRRPGDVSAPAAATAPSGDQPRRAAGDRPRTPGEPGTGGPGGGFGGGFGGGQMANLSPEERQKRFQERLQSMSPEEREQFMQRMRDRGFDPANMGAGSPARGPGPGQGQPGARPTPAAAPRASAQTIDQLFGPLPVTEAPGRAWVYVNNQIKSVRLRLGISDGTYTELLTGDLQSGQELVTSVVTPAQAAAAATRSPLMPGGPGMGGPGGRPSGGMPSGGSQPRR